jgi:hypothetical protein
MSAPEIVEAVVLATIALGYVVALCAAAIIWSAR